MKPGMHRLLQVLLVVLFGWFAEPIGFAPMFQTAMADAKLLADQFLGEAFFQI
jgi:hypothetical protein